MSIQISFIVPVYNTEAELARCLDSLQAVPVEKEIILIDDGSSDNSVAVAQDYFKRFTNIKLLQQHNAGVSAARNQGIALARGTFLQFVDSDDYLLGQEHYPELIAMAEKHQIDVMKTMIQIDGRFPILTRLPVTKTQRYAAQTNGYICKGVDYLDELTENWFPSPCNGFYRTELLQNQKIYFPEKIIQSEDSLFNFDLFSNPNVKVMDTKIAGYLYAHRANSTSHQRAKVEHIQSICKIVELFLARIAQLSENIETNPSFYDCLINNATHIILIELKNMYQTRYRHLNEQQKEQAKAYFSPKIRELFNILELDI